MSDLRSMDHSDRKTTSPISASSTSPTIINTTNTNHSNLTTEASIKSPATASINNANIQLPRPAPYNESHYKDFPSHHFDRNLTIEKATFDSSHQSQVPSPCQQQPPRTSSQQDSHHSITTAANKSDSRESTLVDIVLNTNAINAHPSSTSLHSRQLPVQARSQHGQYNSFTTSSPAKIPETPLTTTAKRYDAIPHSPPRATVASNKTKSSTKDEAEKQYSKKKNRKLPGANGTATPSEVFHRNLVDAVSNVEDADEHEQYVYPYSHHDPSSTSTRSNRYRNQQKNRNPYRRANSPLIASAPGSSLSLLNPSSSPFHSQYNSSGSLLRYSTNTRNSDTYKHEHSLPLPPSQHQHQQQDYYRYGIKHQRQPLMSPAASPLADEERGPWIKRDYHRPKLRSHVMDHNALPQPWAHEVNSSDDEDDDEADDDNNYRHTPDSGRRYLLQNAQRHHRRPGISCAKVLRNTCISIFVFITLMMIFTVNRAEPLTDVSASMEHVLASDKELIFDLIVRANNWNWWQIRIQQADLSVFAFSQFTSNNTFGVDPAEYLGSFQSFDQPLSFTSSAILGPHQQANASAQIRIKAPGADPNGNQRWARMIRYPFGLVTRGVLNYRPFPLFRLSPRQSISLCIVIHIDPISLTLSDLIYNDSDHGYCSHYSPVSPIS